MSKQERIKAAMVGDYELSLTRMLGKELADITGYISQEFGDRSFKVCRLVFTDGTCLGFEGEHDHPYLVEGYGDSPAELSEDLLRSFDENADEEDDADAEEDAA